MYVERQHTHRKKTCYVSLKEREEVKEGRTALVGKRQTYHVTPVFVSKGKNKKMWLQVDVALALCLSGGGNSIYVAIILCGIHMLMFIGVVFFYIEDAKFIRLGREVRIMDGT